MKWCFCSIHTGTGGPPSEDTRRDARAVCRLWAAARAGLRLQGPHLGQGCSGCTAPAYLSLLELPLLDCYLQPRSDPRPAVASRADPRRHTTHCCVLATAITLPWKHCPSALHSLATASHARTGGPGATGGATIHVCKATTRPHDSSTTPPGCTIPCTRSQWMTHSRA
jgi:hypothetical protein